MFWWIGQDYCYYNLGLRLTVRRNRKKVNSFDFSLPTRFQAAQLLVGMGKVDHMRMKYTSIHNVIEANSAAPWVGLGLGEKLKREALAERAKKEKQTTKSERAWAWFRRSR